MERKKKHPARQISDTKLDGINWNKIKAVQVLENVQTGVS